MLECCLTKLAKTKDTEPNPDGSWGIGAYCTEREGEADGYGFYRPKNPNWFYPDFECCEPWKIANHKAACEKYNQETQHSRGEG